MLRERKEVGAGGTGLPKNPIAQKDGLPARYFFRPKTADRRVAWILPAWSRGPVFLSPPSPPPPAFPSQSLRVPGLRVVASCVTSGPASLYFLVCKMGKYQE